MSSGGVGAPAVLLRSLDLTAPVVPPRRDRKPMQLLITRRSGRAWIFLAALLGMIAAPGYPVPVNPPRLPASVAAVGGTISGIDSTAGTVQVTGRNGAAITLTVNTAT